MHRVSRPDGLDLPPMRLHRSQSMTIDRPSISSASSLVSPPVSSKPDPAYIAAAAASQIITSAHESQLHDWFEEGISQPKIETALVSPASLSLVNAFLDQLLYSFLASARSTSLASLRPAVSEVLKPRLAKEAIAGADEELEEFLGGGDEEELSVFHNGQEPSGHWDLEPVWKRTRLRCMVYTRLGDMEEEDEEMYIEQEHLGDGDSGQRRMSRDVGIVSPAVAIFLTSILEFIGEHSLMIAGEAAYSRIYSKRSGSNRPNSSQLTGWERVVVEQTDMEKIAFNSTLGRLWRCWRKRIRSPNASMSRPLSRGSLYRKVSLRSLNSPNSRKSSVGTMDGLDYAADPTLRPSVAEVLSKDEPGSIALPMTENDIEEIEVPGFLPWMAAHLGDFGRAKDGSRRPHSMMVSQQTWMVPPTPISGQPHLPIATQHLTPEAGAPRMRRRSHSLPTPRQARFVTTAAEWPVERTLATPVGSPSMIRHVPESAFRSEDATPLANNQGYDFGFPLTRPSTSDSNWSEDKHSYQSEEEPQILNLKRVSVEVNRTPAEVIQATPRPASSMYSPGLGEGFPVGIIEEERSDGTANLGSTGLERQDSKSAHRTPLMQTARAVDGSGTRERRFIGQDNDLALATPMQGPHTFFNEESDDVKPKASGSGKSRHTRGSSDTSTLSGKDLQADGRIRTSIRHSQTPGGEHGVPNLTPLRELMEAAQDTSDEASSLATSYETLKSEGSEAGVPAERQAPSSPNFPQIKDSSDTGNHANLRKQLPAVYTGTGTAIGTERAAVQRVSPSPVVAREPVSPRARRSNSSSGDKRPIHTSGSGTSQVSHKLKGFIGRQHGDTDKEPIPFRTSSEESGSVISDKHSQTIAKVDDKQRSFEQLMESDETIQYTLTPQNMRQMEAPESPRWTPHKRSGPTELAGLASATNSATAEGTRLTGGRSVVPNKDTVCPKTNVPGEPIARVPAPGIVSRSKGAAQPVSRSTKVTPIRSGQPVARNARIEKESTRDFADFIRSTGPEDDANTTPKIPSPRSVATPRPNTVSNSTSRSTSASQSASPRKLPKSSTGLASIVTPNKAESVSSVRPAFKPREATVPFGDQSSDLIDFIRQGPPLDRSEGTHRIPRTVAPFRTTMDSDEIRDLGHGRTKDAATPSTVASTQDSSMQSKSVHSSVNSRTGLLESANSSGPRSYASSSTARQPPRSDEPPHPVRKQRRVRDPYAIDSDSDEDYISRAEVKPKRDEESLVDFLRNVPPPANEEPVRVQTAGQRFTGNGSLSAGPKASVIRTVSQSFSNSANGENGSRNSPLYPRENASNLFKQNNVNQDTYNPSRPTYATQLDRERNGLSRPNPRTARGHMARSERENGGGSRDLADFIKNSEPPITRDTYPPSVTKEETGFAKMFARRKKTTGVA